MVIGQEREVGSRPRGHSGFFTVNSRQLLQRLTDAPPMSGYYAKISCVEIIQLVTMEGAYVQDLSAREKIGLSPNNS
jgi:hypothetical protein